MSHSIDEYYRVYNVEIRRARKPHSCDACDRAIAPGDRYASVHIVNSDGGGETVKRCGPCEVIHRHLRDNGGGEMWPAEKLDCGEEYTEHWGKEPPEEIAALAFVTDADAGRVLAAEAAP
jgi:RNase P subunit RPR2